MATTAAGQEELKKLIAAGVGRNQALQQLIAKQKAQQAQQFVERDTSKDVGQLNPITTPGMGGVTPFTPAEQQAVVDAKSAATPIDITQDPLYIQAMQRAQSQFNTAKIGALGAKQYEETGIKRQLEETKASSAEARRRLAGNYAARGMAGGARGALTQAEGRANARELAMRTNLRDQLAELNRQFVANYGEVGADWTGTMAGQQMRESAIQNALGAIIPRYTAV